MRNVLVIFNCGQFQQVSEGLKNGIVRHPNNKKQKDVENTLTNPGRSKNFILKQCINIVLKSLLF